jgi:hypothetical protein
MPDRDGPVTMVPRKVVVRASRMGGSSEMLPQSLLLALTAPRRGGPRPESPWPVDEDYWLCHCEGFHVDQPGGRLGVVEYVDFAEWPDWSDVVGVRTGRLGTRTVRVPVADVVEVRPAEERLVLRRRKDPSPGGVMSELRSLLHAPRAGIHCPDSISAGRAQTGR